MIDIISEPQERISPLAIKLWRIHSFITYFILAIVLVGLVCLSKVFHWPNWIQVLFYWCSIPLVLGFVFETFVMPMYKQKTWRYEIGEKYIQLKHGAIKKNYYVIPTGKIQYVNTSQGPISQKLDLSTIKIGTMAYIHEIPAITTEQAQLLRNKISLLAGLNNSEEDTSESDAKKEEKGEDDQVILNQWED